MKLICPNRKKCTYADRLNCKHVAPHLELNNCTKADCNDFLCVEVLEPKVEGIDEIEDIENENNMRRCN